MRARRVRNEEPFDYLQKIIIIGESGVGKSNILLRYSEGKFVDNYMMTIGINFTYKIETIDGARIKLQIWDTAGQDKYKTITQSYYRNSHGVLVVFGLDSRDTFHAIRTWIEELTQNLGENVPVLLVGNKMDLEDRREVSYEEAQSMAKSYGLPYIECSAKSGYSVEETFTKLARMMKEKNIDQAIQGPKLTEPLHISFTADKDNVRKRCCSN